MDLIKNFYDFVLSKFFPVKETTHELSKWDYRFLELAKHISAWSRDPSTKVGCVITDGKNLVSIGFNGFAPGVNDYEERYIDREFKYAAVTHAEPNALLLANRCLNGCTIFTYPFQPCSVCSGQIIRAGIKRVVSPPCSPELRERWGKSIEISETMFKEAGVRLDIMEFPNDNKK